MQPETDSDGRKSWSGCHHSTLCWSERHRSNMLIYWFFVKYIKQWFAHVMNEMYTYSICSRWAMLKMHFFIILQRWPPNNFPSEILILKCVIDSGEHMAVMVTCTLHACYFFLAAVLSSFLETPFFSRMVLLLVVPLNAVTEMRQGTSLNFPTLSFFIISVVLGENNYWVFCMWFWWFIAW